MHSPAKVLYLCAWINIFGVDMLLWTKTLAPKLGPHVKEQGVSMPIFYMFIFVGTIYLPCFSLLSQEWSVTQLAAQISDNEWQI